MNNELINSVNESISLKRGLINSNIKIKKIEDLIFDTLKKKKKLLICGNGGSAADAQHLAAEFLVRLKPELNRVALPIVPLALDTSTITACSNDYSFEKVFSRPFSALANKGDLLIVLSTSGNSRNIISVLNEAKKKRIKSIAFLGKKGGKAKNKANMQIIIKSDNVARIQECHMFLGHFIFNQVENRLFKNKK